MTVRRRPVAAKRDEFDWVANEALGAWAQQAADDRIGGWATPGEMAAELEGDANPAHLVALDAALCEFTAAVERGERPRLLITMPPRHGKSQRAIRRYVPWALQRHPEWSFIIGTYSGDFSAEHGRDVRNFLRTHRDPDEDTGRRGLGVTIAEDSKAAHRWNVKGNRGAVYSVGVDGAVTGRGCHVLIIDDPVKDWKEAQSPIVRKDAWEWFQATASTRLEPGGGIILIQTRWHDEDVAGHVLRSQPGRWVHLDLPAVAEEGRADPLGRAPGGALWPERYDADELAEIRATVTAMMWMALYQQRPVTEGGMLFKESNDRFWKRARTPDGRLMWQLEQGVTERLVDPGGCFRFATADTATSTKTSADWTVVSSWALTPDGDLLLIDRRRQRMEEGLLADFILSATRSSGAEYVGVESTFATSNTAYKLGLNGVRFVPLLADKDKVMRSVPAQLAHETHRVFWPGGDAGADGDSRPAWMDEWLDELHSFPYGTHDDQVDTFSYAAQRVSPVRSRRERGDGSRVSDADSRFDRWRKRLRPKRQERLVGT